MASNQVMSRSGLDSLPASERVRMCWDEYSQLLDEFEEHTPRRARIDACVLQYARAAADVARNDQAAALAREAAGRDDGGGDEWVEHQSLANVPETCDFVVGSAGETTKDVANRGRCGRPAEWRRGPVLACSAHAVGDLVSLARVFKLRVVVGRTCHSREGGGE